MSIGTWLLVAAAQSEDLSPTTLRDMVLHGNTSTQVVLSVLAVLSVVTWAIMITKAWEFRGVDRSSRAFIREFEALNRLDEAAGLVRRARPNPFGRVLERAIRMVPELRSAPPEAREAGATLSGSQVEALRYLLEAQAADERDQLGRFVPWLATVGSASPLIGLLGTVLGIIEAFQQISQQGSASLVAVGPGVAEALIATAAALTVAIPAVFGYNLFANRLNRLEGQLDGFGSEIIAMLVREGRL